MARRLGTAGYHVVLPNLYYRTTRDFDYAAMGADGRRAMFAHVDADPAADATRVGCVGYCMSGPFVVAVAGAFPDRIRAAASLHGVRLFGDGAPMKYLAQARGELYFGCAEHDDYAPPEMIAGLQTYLADSDLNARVEWYPAAHHGFVFPQRGAMYDKPSAERHWERLYALFARTLG